MNQQRRNFLSALGATAAAAWLPATARAQPRVPTLRVLCGYPPGGSIDVISRRIADKMANRVASAAIVDNKTGAAGRIAVQEMKSGPADGSLMLVTPASVLTMYPHVFRNLSYDPFADLSPAGTVAQTAFALAAGPRVPRTVIDVQSFVAWAAAQKNPPQCGNAGAGSMPHFIAMLAGRAMGFEFQHIPFRGGSNAMQAAAAGELDVALATESAAQPLVAAGKLRVLATTGAERSPFFRDARTLKESGYPTLVHEEWFGAFVPARTPPATVQALADGIADALRDRDVRDTWATLGLVPQSMAPSQLGEAMRREHAFWRKTVADFAFTPEA